MAWLLQDDSLRDYRRRKDRLSVQPIGDRGTTRRSAWRGQNPDHRSRKPLTRWPTCTAPRQFPITICPGAITNPFGLRALPVVGSRVTVACGPVRLACQERAERPSGGDRAGRCERQRAGRGFEHRLGGAPVRIGRAREYGTEATVAQATPGHAGNPKPPAHGHVIPGHLRRRVRTFTNAQRVLSPSRFQGTETQLGALQRVKAEARRTVREPSESSAAS